VRRIGPFAGAFFHEVEVTATSEAHIDDGLGFHGIETDCRDGRVFNGLRPTLPGAGILDRQTRIIGGNFRARNEPIRSVNLNGNCPFLRGRVERRAA